MNITHVHLLTVPVSDQDRAKSFYVDTLGFEVVLDRETGPRTELTADGHHRR